VDEPGSGYYTAPTITVADAEGRGSGAVLTAVLGCCNGQVESVAVTDGGTGYAGDLQAIDPFDLAALAKPLSSVFACGHTFCPSWSTATMLQAKFYGEEMVRRVKAVFDSIQAQSEDVVYNYTTCSTLD